MSELLQGFTREYLSGLFAYDPDTGIVTRKVQRAHQFAGSVVGSKDGKGYLHVNLDGVFIRLHRLIWFIETGSVPPKGIDHEDTVRTNNRWSNLRLTDQKGNNGNFVVAGHNTSGYRGVSKNGRSGQWHAQIKIDGKQTYLGRSSTPEMAALIYNAAALDHFGEFARFNLIGQPKMFVPASCRDLFV